MESEEYSLKELLSRVIDNRGKTCPTAETGTALIATNCIKNAELYPVFERVRWVDDATMETWFRGHPEPGDILFVTKGSPGRCCLVPDPVNFCIAQDMLALLADETKVSQKFLFALLRSDTVQDAIENLHVGTMIPHFKKGDFDQLLLQIPTCRKTQDWIGDLYFRLSDRIELNRRMNATLEGMAQALFKSWFVDFDPVIDNALVAGNPIPEELTARAELRRTALDSGTANRETAKPFPDAFVETEELGWIPEGWEVGIVSDLFELHRGFDLPAGERQDGEVPVYSAGGIHGFHNQHRIEAPGIVTGRSGVIGNVYLSLTPYWPLNTTLYVRDFRLAGPYYALHFLRNTDLKVYNSGSAVPSLNRNHVHGTSTLIPGSESLSKYESYARDVFQKLKANTTIGDSLTKLRDTLLPKLISGELRIPDAEKLAEAALA